jgi:hypothetical protein
MKTTFKGYLKEGKNHSLPHWPKTKKQAEEIYTKIKEEKDKGADALTLFQLFPPLLKNETDKASLKTEYAVCNDDGSVSFFKNKQNTHLYIGITREMLVAGHLPFRIATLENFPLSIEKNANLESLIGFPETVSFFTANGGSLSPSITDFSDIPRFTKTCYISSEYIKSMNGLKPGFPKTELTLQCENLTDFDGLQNIGENSYINLEGTHFNENDFKYLNKSLDSIRIGGKYPNTKAKNGLTSLHNLHKYVKHDAQISLQDQQISSSILSLVYLTDINVNGFYYPNGEQIDDKQISPIIREYSGSGKIFEFQDALIEAGFEHLAKL